MAAAGEKPMAVDKPRRECPNQAKSSGRVHPSGPLTPPRRMARIELAATARPRTVAPGDEEENPDAPKQESSGMYLRALAS
jgi:hypothetical protein